MMRKQIELAPLNAAAYESLGEFLASRKKWRRARPCLARPQARPGEERAEKALIGLYARSGQAAKARDLILEHLDEPTDLQSAGGPRGALLDLRSRPLGPARLLGREASRRAPPRSWWTSTDRSRRSTP